MNLIAIKPGGFLHDDTIGAGRHGRTRRYSRRLTSAERAQSFLPRRNCLTDFKAGGSVRPHIICSDGKAVHRRIVETRQRDRGDYIFRQKMIIGRRNGNPHGWYCRFYVAGDKGQRIVKAPYFAIAH